MAVASVGTPSAQRVTSGFTTVQSAWGGGQSRTAGHLLLGLVTGGCTTLANWAVSENSSTWTSQLSIGNNAAGTSACGVAVFTKTAAGTDSAPAFTVSLAGTATAAGCVVTLFELSGANTTAPLDTTGVQQTGSATSTVVFSATTGHNVTAAGEYAIAAFSQQRSSSNLTWVETGSGWTSLFEDAVTSASHNQINTQAGPSAGGTLTDAGHFSTNTGAFGAGAVIVVGLPAAAGAKKHSSSPVPALVATGVI